VGALDTRKQRLALAGLGVLSSFLQKGQYPLCHSLSFPSSHSTLAHYLSLSLSLSSTSLFLSNILVPFRFHAERLRERQAGRRERTSAEESEEGEREPKEGKKKDGRTEGGEYRMIS